LHHVVVERWSRGASFLHARDARVKALALLAYLIALATTRPLTVSAALCYAALVAAAIVAARLPLAGVALRAAAVLPFSASFAAFSWIAGDRAQAASLLGKSYLSAAAVLTLVGATPIASLLRGVESLGMPRLLTLVLQFLYRYLFVVSEQAQHMRLAAQCRGSQGRRWSFRAAAGAVSALFARSYARADGIHRAMLARGFAGEIPLLRPARLDAMDALFLATSLAVLVALRLWLGGQA